MTKIEIFFDSLMCLFWMLTYTLVLIGSIKYKYPLISPVSQAIIAPLEILTAFYTIKGNLTLNYISVAYIYWATVEIAIFIVLKKIFLDKKRISIYFCLIIFTSLVIHFFMITKEEFLFSHYFFTFIGVLVWFEFILRKNYPLKPISLAVFVSKFLADFVAIPTYLGKGEFIIDAICLLLPILDFMFIIVYFKKKVKRRHSHAEDFKN